MSKRKSERLVNLLILLLSTKAFVTRHQIRATIEGYRGQTDAAFERMFERDKEELRQLGIPIVTGTNEPDQDVEDGYRILRSEFELPPLSFTPEELAVLGAAALVWQDTVAADETASALGTLRAAGLDPDVERLQTLRPRIPGEPGFDVVREAIAERREIEFGYRDQTRRVQPWRLQQRRGRWYLLGHDVVKGEPRRFKLARFTAAPQTVGRAGAFEEPASELVDPLLQFTADTEHVTATVAVRQGRGGDLRRFATGPSLQSGPEGFDVLEVAAPRAETLIAEVLSLGSDAVLIAPAEFRQVVVARLGAVAERWQA